MDFCKNIIIVIDDINFFLIGIKGQVIDVDFKKGIGNVKIKISRRLEFIYIDFQGFYCLGLEIFIFWKKKVIFKVYVFGYYKVFELFYIDLKNVIEKNFFLVNKGN